MIHYQDERVTLHHGDALDVLRGMADESIDAVVTDPPYGLEFMGRKWDTFGGEPRGMTDAQREAIRARDDWYGKNYGSYMSGVPAKPRPGQMIAFQQWCETWATECLRVLKPGGMMLAFGGTRTWHRLCCAIEDAGFEIRDSIAWLYGSGFSKGRDFPRLDFEAEGKFDLAAQWAGWNVALKPAHEPVVVARKPLVGTIARNVETYGTGGLNIGATRVSPTSQPHDAGVSAQLSPPDSPRDTEPVGRATAQGVAPHTPAEPCACSSGDTGPVRESARRPRTPSTPRLAASAPSPEARNDLPSSAAERGLSYPRSLGSLADCPSSPCSCDGRAQLTEVDDQASAPPRLDVPESPDRCATCGHTPTRLSNSCAHSTAPDVERPAIPAGRWPPNVLLDQHAADALDQMSGTLHTQDPVTRMHGQKSPVKGSTPFTTGREPVAYADPPSGASSFFPTFIYEAKAPTSERPRVKRDDGADNATAYGRMRKRECNQCGSRTCPAGGELAGPWPSCGHEDWSWVEQQTGPNHVAHPTVKPLALMRWLVRLVTPPGGVILDPFAGSGTTGEAAILERFRAVLIEREPDYLPLIVARLTKRTDPVAYFAGQGGDDDDLFSLLDEDGAA